VREGKQGWTGVEKSVCLVSGGRCFRGAALGAVDGEAADRRGWGGLGWAARVCAGCGGGEAGLGWAGVEERWWKYLKKVRFCQVGAGAGFLCFRKYVGFCQGGGAAGRARVAGNAVVCCGGMRVERAGEAGAKIFGKGKVLSGWGGRGFLRFRKYVGFCQIGARLGERGLRERLRFAVVRRGWGELGVGKRG
jgi:hypothetical protein